jgi:hypothetical protein
MDKVKLGTLITLFAALTAACTNVSARSLKDGIHFLVGPLFYALMCLFLSPILMYYER